MPRYTAAGIILAIGLGLGLGTQGLTAEPVKAFEGRRLFNSNCFLCHGTDGRGNGPLSSKLTNKPGDLSAPAVSAKSDALLARVVQGTAPHGKDLPRWNKGALSEPDVQALIAYIRFIQKSEHALIGDPEVGRQVYSRYCVVCHGEGGRGNGPMASLLTIHPADHTDGRTMNRLSNAQLMTYIAKGGPPGKSFMPAWEGLLTATEIEAVASYVRLLAFKK